MAQQIVKKFIENGAIDGVKIKLLNGQAIRIEDENAAIIELLKLENSKAVVPQGIVATESQVQDARDYTDIQIAALIDSAPGYLNTLNELAAAIGDDPDFAASLTTAIANVQTNLTQEISDRQAADAVLTGSVNSLDARLLTAEAGLAAEMSARATEDSENRGRLDIMEAFIASAQGGIDANETQISSESSSRQSADAELQAQLASEVTERATAIEIVRNDVDQEAQDRQAAISALQTQILNLAAKTPQKQKFILDTPKLSFIDLAFEADHPTLIVTVGRLVAFEGDDYTLSVENNVTRVTWTGSFESTAGGYLNNGLEALEVGDVVHISYYK